LILLPRPLASDIRICTTNKSTREIFCVVVAMTRKRVSIKEQSEGASSGKTSRIKRAGGRKCVDSNEDFIADGSVEIPKMRVWSRSQHMARPRE